MIARDPQTMLGCYPGITDGEFAEACKGLEERSQDNLDGTNWLSVRWSSKGQLEIKQADAKTGNDNSARTSSESSVNAVEELDEKGVEADREDTDAYVRHTTVNQTRNRPAVEFSIVLSPTYRVPVLWFTLSSTKAARIQDLEEIYSRVVDPGSHESLRGIGIMGGISLANHPITDRPMFFVHPCNTPEALAALNDGSNLDPFQYLLLWFGVVGTGVGLHVPSKVASVCET